MSKNKPKTAPQFLDLDALQSPVEMEVKLGGKKHKLRQATVQDFIDTIKDQEALDNATSAEESMNRMIDMLIKSFPTMEKEELLKVESFKLWKLLAWVKDTQSAGSEDSEDSENPQKAEQ